MADPILPPLYLRPVEALWAVVLYTAAISPITERLPVQVYRWRITSVGSSGSSRSATRASLAPLPFDGTLHHEDILLSQVDTPGCDVATTPERAVRALALLCQRQAQKASRDALVVTHTHLSMADGRSLSAWVRML